MPFERVIEIRNLVGEILAERGIGVAPRDEDSLFVSGRLDSVTAVELIMRLESEFGVDFSRLDFDIVAIDSIAAIHNLVRENHAPC